MALSSPRLAVPPPTIAHDPVPYRAAGEPFRALDDDPEPDPHTTEPDPHTTEPDPHTTEPDRGEAGGDRALGDDTEPDRDPDCDWGTAPAPDPVYARLLDQFLRVARRADRHADGVMFCTYEYSLAQILVLRAIVAAEDAGRPPLSAREVAQDLHCSPGNASDLVAALHRRRALTKHRDRANGRIIRLQPTPDGRMAEYHAGAVLAECGHTVFGRLDAAEKGILVRLLEKLTSV